METKGRYFLVGLFTILLGAGMVFFASWIMGGNERHNYEKLVIYFPGNVSGIDAGSGVRYRGVLVGVVDKVVIEQDAPDYIKVIAQVDPKTPLHKDTKVTLQSLGVTGLSFIELETTDHASPLLEPAPGQNYRVLYAQESNISKLLKDVPKMVERYTKVADHLLILLDQKNLDAVSQTLSNAEQFTKNISQHQQEINKILNDTKQVLENFNTNSSNTFNELNYFLRDSRKAANQIENLSKSLQQNPSQIIYQPQYEGYKVTP